jgi:LmbE family N-acetylglucosaminyl deacetylase
MAHPDDEVIFGWPILKQVSSILICSNDKNNLERAWCRYRYKALEDLGQKLGIPVKSLDYDSEFYKLNARDGSLQRFIEDVHSNIDVFADTIYTHNWWGEYGHLDHILIHYVMLQYQAKKGIRIITSNIHLQMKEWVSFDLKPICPGYQMNRVTNSMDLYNELKAIYDKYGVWTWSTDPVMECNTYVL